MTPEHAQARCGRATSSRFVDILAGGKGKTRATYLRQVVVEMLTEKPVEGYSGRHTDRGNVQEPFGRMAYVARTRNMVDLVEFIPHPTLPMIGCSPDGLIDDDGGLELKSVIATVQVETILTGEYPTEHVAQVQGNLWITGRKWWDFASFCDELEDDHLRLYVFRVQRDEAFIQRLEKEVPAFVREAQQLCDQLRGKDSLAELSGGRAAS